MEGGRLESQFVGTKVMAELWDCSQQTVAKWCREGLIAGAEQDAVGSPWRIPIDALKPDIKKRRKSSVFVD